MAAPTSTTEDAHQINPFDGDRVVVATRVRPMNAREKEIASKDKRLALWVVRFPAKDQVICRNPVTGVETPFTLDFCYDSGCEPTSPNFASQLTVYQDLGLGLLKNALDGYNATMFAYGQTGSGKTYTMMGVTSNEEQMGIIPRICNSLFEHIAMKKAIAARDPNFDENWLVQVQFYEIYNEKIRDLFNMNNESYGLKVRNDKVLGVYIENLRPFAVADPVNMLRLMDDGSKARASGATKMNNSSSRSHAVFQIDVRRRVRALQSGTDAETSSKINLVDLAGSERQAKTESSGDRLKEACAINKSLAALGKVIQALVKHKYVHYRDSVLTWLLKESLGGNAKTVMVTTISPSGDNYEETLNTLRYANDAKQIKNKAVINEDENAKMMSELKREVELGQLAIRQAGDEERQRLIAELAYKEKLLEEKQRSWEEQLEITKQYDAQRKKAMEDMGISLTEIASHFGVTSQTPYLVNLSEDSALAECLVYYIKPGVIRVGRQDAAVKQDIVLGGFKIEAEHAQFNTVNNDTGIPTIILEPLGNPKSLVYVNGKQLQGPVELHQGDRVVFGKDLFFRFNHPGEPKLEGSSRQLDWTAAAQELSGAQQKWQTLLRAVKDFNASLEETLRKKNAEAQDMLDTANEYCVVLKKFRYYQFEPISNSAYKKWRNGTILGNLEPPMFRVHDLIKNTYRPLSPAQLEEEFLALHQERQEYTETNRLPPTELEKARAEVERLQHELNTLRKEDEEYRKTHSVPDRDHQKLHDRYNIVVNQKEGYKKKFVMLDDEHQKVRAAFGARLKEHETVLRAVKEEAAKHKSETEHAKLELNETKSGLLSTRSLDRQYAALQTRSDYPYSAPIGWNGTIEQRIDSVLAKPRRLVGAEATTSPPTTTITHDHYNETSKRSLGLGGGGPFRRSVGEKPRQVKHSPTKRDSWLQRV